MSLTPAQRRFLQEKHFAVLGTVNASGTPQLSIMWYLLDGDEIVFNTRAGRVKHANLERDPRVSLLVYGEDGYTYLRVDGRVRTITDPAAAQADIRRLALRYWEDEERVEQAMRETFGIQRRVSYRLPTTRVHEHRD
jgi:PPOX class probable F420-dependent enzyme